MSRVSANDTGDRGSIQGQVIQKTQKIVREAILLNTQHYNVRVKWSNLGKGVATPVLYFGVVAIEKEVFGSFSNEVTNFIYDDQVLMVVLTLSFE